MKDDKRRNFLKNSIKLSLGAALLPALNPISALAAAEAPSSVAPFVFSQIPLPYNYDALEPHIDALTTEIHYTKHHAAYVKNVNDAIKAENLNYADAKAFFLNASRLSPKARNNAGGAWNHNFFFEGLKNGSAAGPDGELLAAIEKSFGSLNQFKTQFAAAATARFGSGWAWLVNDHGTLKISSTANQDNPLLDTAEVKGTPILALDVWEHAYYLKYQNKRADYIAGWWNVVNWEIAAKRFAAS
ncbi:MAG: superoxide dismutase [Bacteroidota bacterium]